MKPTFNLLAILAITYFTFSACGGGARSEAESLADQIKATVKANTPGAIETSKDGFYMSATIDGEEWAATHMIPDTDNSSNSKRIFGENSDLSISFSVYMPGLEAGKKREFSDDHVADFIPTEENTGFWGGKTGEMEITAINDHFMEGKFHFTATSSSSDKKYELTNGYFRIPF